MLKKSNYRNTPPQQASRILTRSVAGMGPSTVQQNLPRALASVGMSTIRKWEHRLICWMDAYWAGLNMKDAQFQVQAFSSRKYTSHQHVPERLARYFDN